MFSRCPSLFPGSSLLLKRVRVDLSEEIENKVRVEAKLKTKLDKVSSLMQVCVCFEWV
jgi:hypothetical protein